MNPLFLATSDRAGDVRRCTPLDIEYPLRCLSVSRVMTWIVFGQHITHIVQFGVAASEA